MLPDTTIFFGVKLFGVVLQKNHIYFLLHFLIFFAAIFEDAFTAANFVSFTILILHELSSADSVFTFYFLNLIFLGYLVELPHQRSKSP